LNNKEIKRVHGTVFKPEEKGRIYKSQEEGFARVDQLNKFHRPSVTITDQTDKLEPFKKLTENHYPDPQERVVILG